MSVNDEDRLEYLRRDAESFEIKGVFFSVLAVAVLSGTFWAKTREATITNLGAGLILLAVGLGTLFYGVRLKKRLKK